MPQPPQGTVTFLFTDIVGSTRLWEKYPTTMGGALARHDALIRSVAENHGGYVFKTVGDAFCVAFHSPVHALHASIDAQRKLIAEDWSVVGELTVRMGVHSGPAEFRDNDYFGGTLNRVARIEAAAHGGQILLSQITVELLQDEKLPGITFKSLGSHRLRNLERPEHLYQAVASELPDSFPPPKSMEVLPNNLPLQTTSFVGREKEIESVKHLLGNTRLLTLMGTGGTGKTRLSLEAGAQLINQFPDGVWQVELAPISDPTRVCEVAAAALGIREEPDRPLRETFINSLKSRYLLLILDNCEHLLSAASALAADLLRTCPRVKIMATSRHSLGIAGETTFFVPPLQIFDIRLDELRGPNIVERLTQYDAVKLFIARATAVRPDFEVTNANAPAVAEICTRLDGIPLAIELAAARVKLLAVDQIAERLGDRFRLLRGGNRDGLPHQQTLQALIDWSHDLLSEPERILFRRMGVFVGGRTLESLEGVCAGDGVDEFDILDLLQQLVDKSLAMVEIDGAGNPRYTFIESVWQYAREKLEASGEADALRNRHLDYFLSLAEKAAPQLVGADQVEWLEKYYSERMNFRMAIEWALKSERIIDGMRMMAALDRATELRGNTHTAAREICEKLLAHPLAQEPTIYRARLLETTGRLCWTQDRYDEARKYYEEAERVFNLAGSEIDALFAHALVGFIDRGDQDIDAADKRFSRGLEASKVNGDLRLRAVCLSGLGSVASDRGDQETARQMKEESVAIYRRLGDLWVVGLILWGIARVAIVQGDLARARSALIEWAGIARALGNEWIFSYLLEVFADVALVEDEPERVARFLGGAEAIRERFGMRFSANEQTEHDRCVEKLEAKLAREKILPLWEAGRARSGWELVEEAMRACPDKALASREMVS